MSSLGERIKKLRNNAKIRQEDLADVLGITTRTVQYYESGKRNPEKKQLVAIAQYFGTTTDFLLGLTDKENNENNVGNKEDLTEENRNENTKNAVYPLGEQREIKIYNLIPKERDEIFAPVNIIGSQLVLADTICTKGFRAIDNSMSGSQILIGTHVLIEEDDSPLDGEIVVAQVAGINELLIRRYTKTNDEITLIPDNDNYKPQTFNANDVRIIGIVTELRTTIGRKSK